MLACGGGARRSGSGAEGVLMGGGDGDLGGEGGGLGGVLGCLAGGSCAGAAGAGEGSRERGLALRRGGGGSSRNPLDPGASFLSSFCREGRRLSYDGGLVVAEGWVWWMAGCGGGMRVVEGWVWWRASCGGGTMCQREGKVNKLDMLRSGTWYMGYSRCGNMVITGNRIHPPR